MQKSGTLCQVDGTFPNKRVFVIAAETTTRGKESRERAGREAGKASSKPTRPRHVFADDDDDDDDINHQNHGFCSMTIEA